MGGQPTGATCWKNSSVPGSLEISAANGSVALVIAATVHIQLPAGPRRGPRISPAPWGPCCLVRPPASSSLGRSVEEALPRNVFRSWCFFFMNGPKQSSPEKSIELFPSIATHSKPGFWVDQSPKPRIVKKLTGMLWHSLYLNKQ